MVCVLTGFIKMLISKYSRVESMVESEIETASETTRRKRKQEFLTANR